MIIKMVFMIFFIPMNVWANFLPDSFTVHFEQTHKKTLSGKTSTSFGVLNYQYPSQIRFEIIKPDKIVFVSNKTHSWYYTAPFIEGEPGELKLNPTKNNVLSLFFDTLKVGLVENKYYKIKKFSEKNIILIFEKNFGKDLGIKEAQLYFKTSKIDFQNLEKMTIKQDDNKEFSLHLKSFVANPKFTKEDFTFKTPENTRISK